MPKKALFHFLMIKLWSKRSCQFRERTKDFENILTTIWLWPATLSRFCWAARVKTLRLSILFIWLVLSLILFCLSIVFAWFLYCYAVIIWRMNANLCNGVLWPKIGSSEDSHGRYLWLFIIDRTIALPGPIMIAPYVVFHEDFFLLFKRYI